MAATFGGSGTAAPPLALDGSPTAATAPRAVRMVADLDVDAHGAAHYERAAQLPDEVGVTITSLTSHQPRHLNPVDSRVEVTTARGATPTSRTSVDTDYALAAASTDEVEVSTTSSSLQPRHFNLDHRAPWLPSIDEAVTVARDPRAAAKRHTWLQEHRAASMGCGLGVGRGPGSAASLRVAQDRLIQCGKCLGLVDYIKAVTARRKLGGGAFRASDGCSARGCTLRYRPGERRRWQRALADGLLNGTKILTRRPTRIGERWTTVVNRADALAAADRAIATLPPPRHPP